MNHGLMIILKAIERHRRNRKLLRAVKNTSLTEISALLALMGEIVMTISVTIFFKPGYFAY